MLGSEVIFMPSIFILSEAEYKSILIHLKMIDLQSLHPRLSETSNFLDESKYDESIGVAIKSFDSFDDSKSSTPLLLYWISNVSL